MSERSSTTLFHDPDVRDFLSHVSWLPFTNPFVPIWAQREQALLPGALLPEERAPDAALTRISGDIQRHVAAAVAHIKESGVAGAGEMGIYRGAAIYALWDTYRAEIQRIISADGVEVPFIDDFVATYKTLLLDLPVLRVPEPGHLLALMYQWRRTVFTIATKIRGRSPSVAAARAAIYQASMGSDACAYARGLYRNLDESPVLITGETGTGKELAAQCVGWSRYIPLDEKHRRFVTSHRASMHSRNLCEVPRDLVESALFGHRKGSFTGATADATGFFALPEAHGSLFLDEIGEIPEHLQVKLLRPLESREIVAIGETKPRPLRGRHIFATNKDLEAEVRAGKFRADLLERMHGMRIHMPSLLTMIDEDPAELGRFVRELVAKKLHDDQQVEGWSRRILGYVEQELWNHAWPRNVRELKHFTERFLMTDGRMPTPEVIPRPVGKVRAPVVAEEPAPVTVELQADPRPATAELPPVVAEEQAPEAVAQRPPESVCVPSSGLFGPMAKRGHLRIDELTRAYVTEVFLVTDQNLSETSRRTGLNRKTARRMIDPTRLQRRLARRS